MNDDTLELREEELVVQRERRNVGNVHIRTRVEEVPARLEVEARSDEVEVEHVPVGEVVSERVEPWQDGDTVVVPIYEEQLVVTKRLLLREHLRVRRISNTRHELFEDTLRKERLEIDDPDATGAVRERYPNDGDAEDGGGLGSLVRRALQ
jgi:uncharacterized protein (TIGR02271 family)